MVTFSAVFRSMWAMLSGKCSGVFMEARKLAGDETGLEMIEYIVMAGLLVAAIVVTLTFFGGTIQKMFGAIAHAITGKSADADTSRTEAQTDATSANTDGEARQKAWGEDNN